MNADDLRLGLAGEVIELILQKIATHCDNLKAVAAVESYRARDGKLLREVKFIAPGELFITPTELNLGRAQQTGGLCTLLEILQLMTISEDRLAGVITALQALDYRHEQIEATIKILSARQREQALVTMTDSPGQRPRSIW